MPFCLPHPTDGGPRHPNKDSGLLSWSSYWVNDSLPHYSTHPLFSVQWHKCEALLAPSGMRLKQRQERFGRLDVNTDPYRIVINFEPFTCLASGDSEKEIRHCFDRLVSLVKSSCDDLVPAARQLQQRIDENRNKGDGRPALYRPGRHLGKIIDQRLRPIAVQQTMIHLSSILHVRELEGITEKLSEIEELARSHDLAGLEELQDTYSEMSLAAPPTCDVMVAPAQQQQQQQDGRSGSSDDHAPPNGGAQEADVPLIQQWSKFDHQAPVNVVRQALSIKIADMRAMQEDVIRSLQEKLRSEQEKAELSELRLLRQLASSKEECEGHAARANKLLRKLDEHAAAGAGAGAGPGAEQALADGAPMPMQQAVAELQAQLAQLREQLLAAYSRADEAEARAHAVTAATPQQTPQHSSSVIFVAASSSSSSSSVVSASAAVSVPDAPPMVPPMAPLMDAAPIEPKPRFRDVRVIRKSKEQLQQEQEARAAVAHQSDLLEAIRSRCGHLRLRHVQPQVRQQELTPLQQMLAVRRIAMEHGGDKSAGFGVGAQQAHAQAQAKKDAADSASSSSGVVATSPKFMAPQSTPAMKPVEIGCS